MDTPPPSYYEDREPEPVFACTYEVHSIIAPFGGCCYWCDGVFDPGNRVWVFRGLPYCKEQCVMNAEEQHQADLVDEHAKH